MHGISHFLSQPVTYGGLTTIFVTWLICDVTFGGAYAALKRSRKRRKAG